MVTAIIDASVAVKWMLREADSDRARALAASSTRLLAPEVLVLEVANALRKAVAARLITRTYAEQSLGAVRRIFDPLLRTADLVDEAFGIAMDLKYPIYDCIYLAASRRLATPLVTADATFAAKLAGTPDAANVILLSDWV